MKRDERTRLRRRWLDLNLSDGKTDAVLAKSIYFVFVSLTVRDLHGYVYNLTEV